MRSSRETVTQQITVVIGGRSNQELGRALYAAAGTVKHHVEAILIKLDAMGRTQAVAITFRCGLVHLV
jgi:two-component system NarL family response regulator